MFRTLTPRQLAFDVTAAALCFLAALAVYGASSGVLLVVTLLGMSAALGLRRVSPPIALAVAWASAILQMLGLYNPNLSDLAVLPVLFATAAYGSRLVKWLGFGSAFAGAATVAGYLITLPGLRDSVLFSLNPLDPVSLLTHGELLPVVTNTFAVFIGVLALFMLSWVLGLLAKTFLGARESRRAQAAAEIERVRAQQDVSVEQERTRIARDMHDVVAHSLAVVIAQADGARYARASDPAAVDEALLTISTVARDALGDVRVLLGQLRHSQAEGPQPTLADLDSLLDQFRGSGLVVDFIVTGEPGALATGQQLAVYRIVQEALTNALRHGSRARATTIEFAWTPDAANLTITSPLVTTSDSPPINPRPINSPLNSPLIAPAPIPPARNPRSQNALLDAVAPLASLAPPPLLAPPATIGHGIAGMRERALLAGGSFTAGLNGVDFVVQASIPLPASATGSIRAIVGSASAPDSTRTAAAATAAAVVAAPAAPAERTR